MCGKTQKYNGCVPILAYQNYFDCPVDTGGVVKNCQATSRGYDVCDDEFNICPPGCGEAQARTDFSKDTSTKDGLTWEKLKEVVDLSSFEKAAWKNGQRAACQS